MMLVASKTPSDQKSYKSNKVVLYNGNKSLHLLYGIITWFIGKVNFCSLSANLPRITGNVAIGYGNAGTSGSGAFYNGSVTRNMMANGGTNASPRTEFSSTRSSSLYTSTNVVRPLSRRTVFLIRY